MRNAASAVIACFDFDGTMIRGDSIVRYLRMAYRAGALPPREYLAVSFHSLRYLMGLESADQSKNRALRFRRALSAERRERMDAAFARDELFPLVYPEARACLEAHKQAGHITLLVTASTENYMRFVSEALGFDALLATPLSAAGEVTDNCRGEEKVRRIRNWLDQQGIAADLAASYAYGDSKSDLPMLRLVGHPTQVNPKASLRRAADMPAVQWRGK